MDRASCRAGERGGNNVISCSAIVARPGDKGQRCDFLDRDCCRARGRWAVDAVLVTVPGDDIISLTVLVATLGDKG